MRISREVQELIKKSICDLDPDADVYLFGSRVHDDARGGDIDLLVASDRLGFRDLWPIRRSILDEIGWQKLDIVLRKKEQLSREQDAMSVLAKTEGVSL